MVEIAQVEGSHRRITDEQISLYAEADKIRGSELARRNELPLVRAGTSTAIHMARREPWH